MTTVKVKFPDGIIDWPARPRSITVRPIGEPPKEIDVGPEPIPDSDWAFKEVISSPGWMAISRR